MNEDLQVHDLVNRAQVGEVSAFEALYHRHQAGLYTFILSQVRNQDRAADLTQDTFVRAWESLAKLRSPGAFRGWLYQIAMNLIRDEVKSGWARREMTESALNGKDEMPPTLPEPSDSATDPEREALAAETKQAVWQALAQLNADQRAVVIMHHLEGMAVAEIAKTLKIRPGTIMSRLARAREILRKRLAPLVEGVEEYLGNTPANQERT